jgi:hypothetical protein
MRKEKLSEDIVEGTIEIKFVKSKKAILHRR